MIPKVRLGATGYVTRHVPRGMGFRSLPKNAREAIIGAILDTATGLAIASRTPTPALVERTLCGSSYQIYCEFERDVPKSDARRKLITRTLQRQGIVGHYASGAYGALPGDPHSLLSTAAESYLGHSLVSSDPSRPPYPGDRPIIWIPSIHPADSEKVRPALIIWRTAMCPPVRLASSR